MEKQKLIEIKINKKKSIIQKKKLYFIGIIKFIQMLIIIKVHLYHNQFFYAIRACEILFISSGFLVGYNYYDKDIPNTFNESFKYYYKHLRTCYPLYLINFLYGIFIHKKIKLDLKFIEIFLVNIFMLQVWSRHRKLNPLKNL